MNSSTPSQRQIARNNQEKQEKIMPKEESQDKMYTFECNGCKFTIDKKYEFKRFLGHGDDGPACLVMNKKTNQLLKILKIENVFNDLYYTREIVREVCFTRFFDHENILQIADIMQSQSETGSQNLYLVTEHLETTLRRVVLSLQPLSNAHIQFFMYQILRGLFYLHSTGLIHRALSSNILLLSQQCDLKISKLRLTRPPQEKSGMDYDYIANRYYMSPENLLGYKYTQAMDIWAAGCILGELLGRAILFPGHDHKHQIQTIFNLIGTPEEDDLGFKLSTAPLQYLKSLTKANRTPWSHIFPETDPLVLDLLDNMLIINPEKRFTVVECLNHPYFEDLHDQDDESVCKEKFLWDFTDNSEPMQESLQAILDEEISKIHSSK